MTLQQPDDRVARPGIVDAAFAFVLTAAACVLVLALMLPFQIDATVRRQLDAAAAQGVSEAQLHSSLSEFVVTEVVVAALFVGLLVWTAFRLRAGRRPFRVLLIVLAVLSLLPANPQALLVAGLLVVAIVLVFRKPASGWMTTQDAARATARARRRI